MVIVKWCNGNVYKMLVPKNTLVLTPASDVFKPVFRVSFSVKARGVFFEVHLPEGAVLRVKEKKVKYYLLENCSVVRLELKPVKLLHLNKWGWGLKKPSGEYVAIIYWDGENFRRYRG